MTVTCVLESLIVVCACGQLSAENLGNETTGIIDHHVEAAARRDRIHLPPKVSDDLFLRRISLDLIGRIPTRQELTSFRADPDRARMVQALLTTEEYAESWSRRWTATLIGYGDLVRSDRESLRTWLASQFAQQTPIDDVVYQLISAEGHASFVGPANFMLHHARDPVVPVGRIFLGVQLDCARCHDHPTDRWSQADFKGMQRFFAAMRPRQPSPGNYELIDGDSRGEPPRFLTGIKPRTERWRKELALMVTTSKPFDRAIVNRLWYHFFGHGIVDPPDAVNGHDRSGDFELVQKLAERFRNDGYQLNNLIREICLSDTYQREILPENEDWALLPTTKPLTPDQLFTSLHVAVDEPIAEQRRSQFLRVARGGALDRPFVNAWEVQESTQALMSRMNMPLPTLAANTTEIFERVLSRAPTPEQRESCQDQRAKNVWFALLNSNEFYFWH